MPSVKGRRRPPPYNPSDPPGGKPWDENNSSGQEHHGNDWKKAYGGDPGAWWDKNAPSDVAKKFEILLSEQLVNLKDKLN